jgi:hypothetical protein
MFREFLICVSCRSTLVNLLKTPSKTPRLGTAKKTRTVLAKEKDKENRLRLANAELKENDGDSRSHKAKSVSVPDAMKDECG